MKHAALGVAGLVLACLLTAWAAPVVHAHGASRGLHLHVEPDPARPGSTLTVDVDTAKPIVRLRVAFVGEDAREVELEAPARAVRFELELPGCAPDATRRARVAPSGPPEDRAPTGATRSLHAEAVAADGTELRASAIVRLEPPCP